MKRILYSLVGLFLFTTVATAQSGLKMAPNKEFKKSLSEDDPIFRYNQGAQRLSSYDDTIWFDGFETPANWTINNQAAGGWQISSTLGTWFFSAANAINSTTGGNYAVMVPENPTTTTPTSTLHTITTANPIDISAYSNQNLVLSYEKAGGRFLDTLKVQVSNNGVNWTTLDFNVDFPLISTAGGGPLANPTSRDLFVPISIVNGSDLYIRFTWDADNVNQPGVAYGWFIDDVALFNVPANDLVLEQTAFFDDVRILYEWYYGAMPERQAAADEITFSATYVNRGSADQTNTRLELSVSGQDNQTFTSASSNVLSGQLADTARTTTIYAPNNGTGTYTFTWNVLADNVDDVPSNNIYSLEMDVTDNEFSMAPLPVSSANILGKGGASQPYVLTQDYFFNAEDTLTSMGIALDQEWTVVGASFQLSVIDENDAPVAQTSIYVTDASMITGDMVYFPLPETVIPAGFYQARLEVFAESLYLVSCQDPIPPIEPSGTGGFFSRTTLSFNGNNFIEDMVYMTIRTKTIPNCNPNAEVVGAVFDFSGEEPFEASIEISDVNGLTGTIFTYSWTGPLGFVSSTMNIDELTEKGDYTLVATDPEGCTAAGVFNVNGNVSVGEIENQAVINVFPNPSNGNFNVSLDNANGAYEISVVNSLGQVAATKVVTASGSNQIVEFSDLNLPTGVYTVTVANTKNSNAPSVFKVVVE